MNILGCLDRPMSGVCRLGGVSVRELRRDALAEIRNEKIGFVFQQFNLLPRTSALENVELPLLYVNAAVAGSRERADHRPNQLSGGQQQRVAIARALVNRPQIVLADEPTGALDSPTSVEILAILQRLNRGQGITTLIVTHWPDIAAYANRRILSKTGGLSSMNARSILGGRSARPPGCGSGTGFRRRCA